MLYLIIFLGGVGIGAFGAMMLLWWMNKRTVAEVLSPEEFRRYKRDWDSVHDEYGACDGATIDEIFLDLGEDEWPVEQY